jgi:Type II CAAX prenyl endopeptidase Rce1-like
MSPKETPTPSRFQDDFDPIELAQPDFITVLKLIWHTAVSVLREKPGQILASAFLLLMVWGFHGNLELLRLVLPGYWGPGVGIGMRPQIIPGIPWDDELISFWGGALLVVAVPMLIIRLVFKERWSDYGLGFPAPGRRKLALWGFLTLTVLSLPAFYLGSQNADMQKLYPFYRPFVDNLQFALYELSYFPFFLAIEFIFRGYLLFGLESISPRHVKPVAGGAAAPIFFGKYALLIQMLSYTAWHLGKPLPELWGTLVWGIAAGAIAWAVRSIWPIVISHWLLNVFLDWLIVHDLTLYTR